MRSANLSFTTKDSLDRRGWGSSIDCSKRVRALSLHINSTAAANAAYPKRRGAGVKPFALNVGDNLQLTPFNHLLTLVLDFATSGMRLSSRFSLLPHSPSLSIGELDRICYTILRLLNDRMALLWRGSPEDDVSGTYQNALLLAHEIFRTMSVFSSLSSWLSDTIRSVFSSNRHLRPAIVVVCQLSTKIKHHVRMTLPQLNCRIEYFMRSCVTKIAHVMSTKYIKPGSFQNCIVHKSQSVRSGSRTNWAFLSPRSASLALIDQDKGSEMVSEENIIVATKSPVKGKPKLSSGSVDHETSINGTPLTLIRFAVLKPLYTAVKSHCEHPISMQMLSIAINATLEQFLGSVLAEVTSTGIDASGVRSIFEQLQELRAWVITVKEALGLQVLLQDINSWLRVDEILTILCGDIPSHFDPTGVQHSGGSIDHSTGSIRRYDNGAIESKLSFNKKSQSSNSIRPTRAWSQQKSLVPSKLSIVKVMCAPALAVVAVCRRRYKSSDVVPLSLANVTNIGQPGVHPNNNNNNNNNNFSRLSSNSSCINVSICSTGAATVAAGITALTRSQQIENLIQGRVLLTEEIPVHHGVFHSASTSQGRSTARSGGVEGIDAAAGLGSIFSVVPSLSTLHSMSHYRDDVFWDDIIHHGSRKMDSMYKGSSLTEKERDAWTSRALRLHAVNVSFSKKLCIFSRTGKWETEIQTETIRDLQTLKIETSDM